MGGGGGGQQPTSSTTTQELSPEQRAIIKPLIPTITEFGQTPIEQFEPTIIQDFNPAELAAQQTALTAAGTIGQNVEQAGQFANFLQSPEALDPNTNPALRANIDAAVRPLTQSFAETILPNIRGQEVIQGQVGGSRGRLAEQSAVDTLLRQIGETSSGIVGQNFSDVLGAGTQALSSVPQIAGATLQPSQIQASIGGAERSLFQAQLQEEAQRFGAEQLKEFAPAQAAIQTAVGIPGGTAVTQGTAPGATGASPFSSALGGASLGFSMGGPWGAAAGAIAGLILG
jgi:hypothetical protein